MACDLSFCSELVRKVKNASHVLVGHRPSNAHRDNGDHFSVGGIAAL